MSQPREKVNPIAKAAKDAVLAELCNSIRFKKNEQSSNVAGNIEYGYVARQISGVNRVCPDITRNDVYNELRRHKRIANQSAKVKNPTPTDNNHVLEAVDTDGVAVRKKGGRPVGSTDVNKKVCELSVIAAKNEIALTLDSEKKALGKKRLRVGRLDEIIRDVKRRNGLPKDLVISKAAIRQRLKKKGKMMVYVGHGGHTTPLQRIESEIVSVLIQMARIRESLTPSQAIQLINSMIVGTSVQRELVEFKDKYSHGGKGGCVGQGYWAGFKKRNWHLIRSKRGQKYELDRASWSTYCNFCQMYSQVYEQMVEAKVAIERDTPEWQDASGAAVAEEDAFGCRVTHDLQYPEMCIVMDEVGGNTSQKGDGNNGGELHMCGVSMTPQQKASTKDKHFTLLGLTALNGDPVMCVVIFAGKRETKLYETGMDIFAEQIGEVGDEDFFEKNSGKGRRYPGGPTCSFQGKTVPCLTRFSPKGSITSAILVDILATLDLIGVFDRSDGKVPFLLLDGHGSRIELHFLAYINDPAHKWVVCIGVPYGTALWQVGDSSEQNGAYMMALSVIKAMIIERKQERMMPLTIDAHEIIIMVNYAWELSFARCAKNKKAIADRGWSPLNRAILLNPTIRATMTTQQGEEEASLGVMIPRNITQNESTAIVLYSPPQAETATSTSIVPYSATDAPETGIVPYSGNDALSPTSPVFDPKLVAPPRDPDELLNYTGGTAAFCIENIVRMSDLQSVREKIKSKRDEGKTLKEQLQEGKKVTAGRCFKSGTCRLGQTVFDVVRENKAKRNAIDAAKSNKDREECIKKAAAAAVIRALGKPNKDLTVNQLKVLLAALKRKGDAAIPSRRAEILLRLSHAESRVPLAEQAAEEAVVDAVAVPIPISTVNEDDDESDYEGDYLGQQEEV